MLNCINELGFNIDSITDKQIKLFSLPLHLFMLQEIAKEKPTPHLSYKTAKELFDHYWTYKATKLRLKNEFGEVVTEVAKLINNTNSLQINNGRLLKYESDVQKLASEHILVLSDGYYSFFHESFYDYCYFRYLLNNGKDFKEYFTKLDYALVKRSDIRVLSYLREEDFEQYIDVIRYLIGSKDIRPYLKSAVFDLLKQLDNPTKEEWSACIVVGGLTHGGYEDHVWRIVAGSTPWFKILDELGIVEQYLASEDTVYIGINLLRTIQNDNGDRVAVLLAQYINKSAEWNERLASVIAWSSLQNNTSQIFLDFFFELLKVGALDQAKDPLFSNGDFWNILAGLEKKTTRGFLSHRGCLFKSKDNNLSK